MWLNQDVYVKHSDFPASYNNAAMNRGPTSTADEYSPVAATHSILPPPKRSLVCTDSQALVTRGEPATNNDFLSNTDVQQNGQ